MATLLIHSGALYTPFEVIEDGALLARDGRIEWAGARAEVAKEKADTEIDVAGRLICPGFVDLQVNGGGGAFLTEEPSPESLERIARAHVRFGTTALLPTIITTDEATTLRALEAVREATSRPPAGARVLGSHLEGPFINPKKRGAHEERHIQPPRLELLERFLQAAGDSLRLITLAPELPGALELIAAAKEAGAAIALGHTDATLEEAQAAIDAGASAGTHIFNAMRALHHREPGVAGALLDDERVVATVIADGVHVHPSGLRIVARAKGAAGTALVTDAMPPAGTDVSSFTLGGRSVSVRDGACNLEDGTLAGSVLTMNRAVDVMHREAGVPLRECIEMATATPARVLGLQGEIGVLAPGARADVVVLNDDMSVWRVFVGGEPAYDAGA